MFCSNPEPLIVLWVHYAMYFEFDINSKRKNKQRKERNLHWGINMLLYDTAVSFLKGNALHARLHPPAYFKPLTPQALSHVAISHTNFIMHTFPFLSRENKVFTKPAVIFAYN